MAKQSQHQRFPELPSQLKEVRSLMASCLAETSIRDLVAELAALFSGKMLRSRLTLHLGAASGAEYWHRLKCAAAVEMVHAASLLHDDVIDGGILRRGAPAVWVQKGIPAAILLGDLLVFKAMELVRSLPDPSVSDLLIRLTGEMVEGEVEQELVLRGATPDLSTCLRNARRKTGPLFAFAAAAAGAPEQRSALLEVGYLAGTAYQLSDDILDARGDPEMAGKTLGLDAARNKNTCARPDAFSEIDPIAYVHGLCEQATSLLAPWPRMQNAWQNYLASELRPALDKNLALRPP